ncbi:MAG: hypothetical protein QOC90_1777, partial [Mycobacterium sp.]|nr:hypothetical protein [Mycobacterium sp.]
MALKDRLYNPVEELSRLPLLAKPNGGHTVGLSWGDVDRPTRTCRLGRNHAS